MRAASGSCHSGLPASGDGVSVNDRNDLQRSTRQGSQRLGMECVVNGRLIAWVGLLSCILQEQQISTATRFSASLMSKILFARKID